MFLQVAGQTAILQNIIDTKTAEKILRKSAPSRYAFPLLPCSMAQIEGSLLIEFSFPKLLPLKLIYLPTILARQGNTFYVITTTVHCTHCASNKYFSSLARDLIPTLHAEII